MKAHFNNLLEQQKHKVQNLESQVSTAKLTYADALRNLEQISDEIHQKRSKAIKPTDLAHNKQISLESNESFMDEIDEEEYKSLPRNLTNLSTMAYSNLEEIEGYKNVSIDNSISPISPVSQSEDSERIQRPMGQSQSNEWTEINLDISSPEEDIPYKKLDSSEDKPKLTRQKTMPNPTIENEYTSIKNKVRLDSSISNWISRSSAKSDGERSTSRRQSLDNLLGPTGEKVKEIFTHGMMMLNIGSLTERRNSEPKAGITEDKGKSSGKKLPSPLEKTLTYLNIEDDNSDTESLSSVDMLNEEQINSLMLDKEIGQVCEQVLGTPIAEVVSLPHSSLETNHAK
ncbi:hypothetical protein AMK59_928 [Oryctes borbonicus]|uniref:SH3 domain-binding protein 5-like n=1 Tax=Oryctes borbonicus TaxID=1629725 RepID=A0A0T6BF44_9SCAR|nr:hypothetical protein AMK59_928 [Oryctes borbonicus]